MTATTVKHLQPTRVELEFVIPADELDAARERAFRELSRNARIPGFRPGKVPRKLFEAQYGVGGISERALENVVPVVYDRAVRENVLEPIGRPEMSLLPAVEGEPLRVRALVTVRPAIALGTYRGLELAGGPLAATDVDFDATLERLRREAAALVPVERPTAFGDVPTLDFLGKIDGVPFDGGAARNQPTELVAERFIPGFAEGIVGMSAGETKDIEATFPADYGNDALAGKTAVFTVTVHANTVAELPTLDDAFASRFGPEMTVEKLRADVRSQLDTQVEEATQRAMAERAIAQLVDAHEFELPEPLVENETEHLVGEARGRIEQTGGSWDGYLADLGKSDADVRAECAEQAARRVKTTLIVEAIAKAEDVRAASEDVELEVEALSRHYRRSREDVVKMIQQNPAAFLEGIVRSKTIALLLEHAVIDGMTPADREAQAERESASAETPTATEPAEATDPASA